MKIKIDRTVVQHAIEALRCCYGYSESAIEKISSAITNLSEALVASQNQLDDIDVADMAAPNSVEIDGIKTDPAQQDPAAYLDEEINCAYTPEGLDGGSAHGLIPLYATPQPAQQQEPDALHLAAMDLARKQAQRIAELEAEVERFRQHALNEKAARQALEQQPAALVPLTDEQMHEVRQ
jgi:hypothetical protein